MNEIQPEPAPLTLLPVANRYIDKASRDKPLAHRHECGQEGAVHRFIDSDNMWGVMNTLRHPLSNHRYSYIAPFQNGTAEAVLKKKTVMVNTMNHPATDPYDCIVPDVIPRRSIMWNDEECLLINSANLQGYGKWYDGYAVNQGVLTMKQGTMWVIVDENAQELHDRVEAVGVFSAGLALVRLWGSWNYVTKRGEFLLRTWLPKLPHDPPPAVAEFYERLTL